VTEVTVTFTWKIHTYFALKRLFFHKIFIFNTLLPNLGKTLYISVVKFPASTSQHMTKTLFKFAVICKMASMWCIPYKDKRVAVGGCQICLTHAQAGVRLGIVVKEKDVFGVSVRTNCMHALSQFV
jgi:hypothetical protein